MELLGPLSIDDNIYSKYLRYSILYLQAECHGVPKALKTRENFIAKQREAQQTKGLRKDITIVERLYHLTNGDKWE